MLGHDFAEDAAERLGLIQRGNGTVGRAGRQGSPDRHALLDVARVSQGSNGIVVDHPGLRQVIEEAVDDTGAVQQGRRRPPGSRFFQPRKQDLAIQCCVALGNVLEAMQDLAITGAAVRAAQAQVRKIAGDHRSIGGRPPGHDSTSDPGTSSAMALRSSVASLR